MEEFLFLVMREVTAPPVVALTRLFTAGAWILVAALLLKGGLFLLAFYKNKKYVDKWRWVHLAIDVPQLNVQTPKAVEQMFAHIFSIYEGNAIALMYRRGFEPFSFSFEIVSIEGYIQFVVRVLEQYRDVMEAALYAQYPEAEITEIEDYTKGIPEHYPDKTYNMWGAEFKLVAPDAYPLRVYRDFEHMVDKDAPVKDPMGTFLESFSRIGPGEQMWYQMVIEPTPDKEWKKDSIEEINKLIGEKKKPKKQGFLGKALDIPIQAANVFGPQLVGSEFLGGGEGAAKEGKSDQNKMQYLTPGQKKLVEAMEDKISKIGYKTKIRMIYVARKEIFNPARGVNSLIGAINQFNNPTSNALLPKYLTSTKYLFADRIKNERKRKIMQAYKERAMGKILKSFVLNIEELATIWHFPMSHVRVPLLQKAGAKKTEPPSDLPVEGLGMVLPQGVMVEEKKSVEPTPAPDKPAPRRYMTDSGHILDS